MSLPPIPTKYAKIFRESLPDLKEFLPLTVEIFWKSSKSVYGILPMDEPSQMILPNWREQSQEHAPFCHYIRTELGFDNVCRGIDKRVAEEVARTGQPLDYWCDWGMVDIAVPIMLHGFCVGVMFCGQKTLKDESDKQGLEKMEAFAREHGLQDHIEVLREKRADPSLGVSRQEVDNMKEYLWASSRYTSRVLYSQLNPQTARLREENRRRTFQVLDKGSAMAWKSNFHGFWNDFGIVLRDIKELFDARGIAVCHTEGGKTKIVQRYGLSLRDGSEPALSADKLITRNSVIGDEPGHQPVKYRTHMPDCVLSRTVMQVHNQVDMILYHKLAFGDMADQLLHFLVFLESALPHNRNLRFQQKKVILDQAMRITADVFWLLQRNEDLRKERKKSDQFLTDVAHQLNQPLHGLVGLCEILVDQRLHEEKRKRLPVYIQELSLNCSILAKSVEIAGLSDRDFATSQRLNPQPINLTRLLIECAINVRVHAEKFRVTVHVDETTTDPLGLIVIDEQCFRIAMTNVVFNAVKYSHRDTKTTVKARHDKQSGRLIISVRNIGIGIPQDKWEQIFEKRMRTGQAVKHSYSGLGIGLTVTRRILRLLGGDVYVDKAQPLGMRADGRKEQHEVVFALVLPEAVIAGVERKKQWST